MRITERITLLSRQAAKALGPQFTWLLKSHRGRRFVAGGVLFGAVAGLALARPVCLIEPGQAAVRLNLLSGEPVELHEGWALLLPQVHRLRRFGLRDQIFRTERAARANSEAPFQSVEGLSIGVDVSIRYALDPTQLARLAQGPSGEAGAEVVEPVADGILRRIFAQHTVRELFATQRVEVQKAVERELRPALAADGVMLKSVFIGNVDLPAQYRAGLESLLAEELSAEKMRFTLELKDKLVKQSELEGAADKVRREQAAEASGAEEIIAAKSKAEAMRHILPFKEKEIEQRRLEAEASKVSRVTQAEGEAEAHRIVAAGEADARKLIAASDAYRVEVVGKASSEQLSRESRLISDNPLLIQKTLADKLSDKIQVIIAPPQAGGFFASGLLGQPPPTRVAAEHTEPADSEAP